MGKKQKKRKQRAENADQLRAAAESRTAVAANVGWMLCLMATFLSESIGLLCRWYTAFVEPVELLIVLSRVMLFVALISGTLTLIMIPVVFRVSRVRPPSSIVQISVFCGILPALVVIMQLLFSN